MHTANLIQEIAGMLTSLYGHIAVNATSGHTDLNIDSEDFFCVLLNMAYGYSLENANYASFNMPGYDLIDKSRCLLVQVTSEYSRSKIQSTLNTLPTSCEGFNLKFLMIYPNKKRIRNTSFVNPMHVVFSPMDDVLSIADVINRIHQLNPSEVEDIYDYVRKELTPSTFINVSDSVLAKIIDILIHSKSRDSSSSQNSHRFSIDAKIEKNGLNDYRDAINMAAIYSNRLWAIYKTYEEEGELANVPIQLDCNDAYVRLRQIYSDPIKLYNAIVEDRLEFVKQSANCPDVGIDQLRMGVRVIIADAFLKCSIFEGPDLTKGD